MHATESYTVQNIDKNSYAMHTIKITPNLLFEYQCTSGKIIRLPNRIEKIDSVARIESNRNFFLPELECSSRHTDEALGHVILRAQSVVAWCCGQRRSLHERS